MGLFDDEDEDDLFGGGRAGTKFSSGAPRAAAPPPKRMPYFYRSFPAKEPYNSWLFCEKRPAT